MGEPKAGLKNAIVVGAVNLVLDPVLMFGCGLGVAGAAMATAAAQWVRPFFPPPTGSTATCKLVAKLHADLVVPDRHLETSGG